MRIFILLVTALACNASVQAKKPVDLIKKSRIEEFNHALTKAIQALKKGMLANQAMVKLIFGMKSSGLVPRSYSGALQKLLAHPMPYSDSLDKEIDEKSSKKLISALAFPNFDAPITEAENNSGPQLDRNKVKKKWNEIRAKLLIQFLEVMKTSKVESQWTYKVILEKIMQQAKIAKHLNPESQTVKTMLACLEEAKSRLKKL